MTGLVVLLVAVLVAALAAWALKARDGRFAGQLDDEAPRLTSHDLGITLGARATLVQFSSAFCSPCRATRILLADISNKLEGVETVDIDAEEHLGLVRELGIMRTPTVLVLDATGRITTRASGLPRREQVLTALGMVDMERN